jgi:hypothetical protein
VHDAAIERALATELPAVFAARDAAGRQLALAALLDHPAFAAHGGELATAWRDMISCLGRWLRHDPGAAANHETGRELRARVEVVSDQLAARQLGYYLEPVLAAGARPAGVYGYRIAEVAFVRAGERRVRVLAVRALGDDANGSRRVLGVAAFELDDPIVLLDEVDAKVTSQILPVLYGTPYAIGDAGWARTRRGREMASAAAQAIRRELLTALGSDVESFDRAAARTRRLVAASVRNHEAQHALDHGRDLAYPPALAAAIGEPADTAFALRARYELSAYLSQLASDTWLPQLVLWNLSRHAFRRGTVRVAEAYVAAIVIERLAHRLGIRVPGRVVERGVIDRDRLAALLFPLATRPTTELRSAAAAAWEDLFGARLVRIVDDSPRPR